MGQSASGLSGLIKDWWYTPVASPEQTAPPLDTISIEERKKLSERRERIATEILQTEQNYVKALTELNTCWELPLRKAIQEGKQIISKEECRNIFSNAEAILKLHQVMLISFEERIKCWSDTQLLGKVFEENAPVLKLYVEYVNNYDNSMKSISLALKGKPFAIFVESVVGVVDTYQLSSLLIQPIQRIPRYEMLLTDMVKNTWEAHPDLETLQHALAAIKEVAKFVNAQKKKLDDSQKLIDIQNKVGKELFAPHRVVILDNELILAKNGKKIPIKCCLFNDTVLVWEETEKSLVNRKEGKIHFFEEIMNITLKEEKSDDSITIAIKKQEWVLVFSPEAKIKKEDWINLYKKAQLNLSTSKETLKITTKEEKVLAKDPEKEKPLQITKEHSGTSDIKSSRSGIITTTTTTSKEKKDPEKEKKESEKEKKDPEKEKKESEKDKKESEKEETPQKKKFTLEIESVNSQKKGKKDQEVLSPQKKEDTPLRSPRGGFFSPKEKKEPEKKEPEKKEPEKEKKEDTPLRSPRGGFFSPKEKKEPEKKESEKDKKETEKDKKDKKEPEKDKKDKKESEKDKHENFSLQKMFSTKEPEKEKEPESPRSPRAGFFSKSEKEEKDKVQLKNAKSEKEEKEKKQEKEKKEKTEKEKEKDEKEKKQEKEKLDKEKKKDKEKEKSKKGEKDKGISLTKSRK